MVGDEGKDHCNNTNQRKCNQIIIALFDLPNYSELTSNSVLLQYILIFLKASIAGWINAFYFK